MPMMLNAVHGINFAEQYETAFNHFYEESQNVTE